MACHGCRIITTPDLAPDAPPLELIRAHVALAQGRCHPLDAIRHLRAAEKRAADWPDLQARLCEVRIQYMAQRTARAAGSPARRADWSAVDAELKRLTNPTVVGVTHG